MPFYVFMSVSKRYRQQFIHVIHKLFSRNVVNINIHNEVAPES